MAEMQWTRPLATTIRSPLSWPFVRRLSERLFDWEGWLTLVLALGAVVSVAATLEGAGWSDHMPAITLVSVIAVVTAMLMARSGTPMYVAWPLSLLLGALVLVWQALDAVGPGSFAERLDAVYARFDAWFTVAGSRSVTNDSLPFNTFVLALTWLGVFLFGWSVFRWNNAWLGLIPGGIALFLDLALIGDALTSAAVLYMLFGFLLVMRTNLVARMQKWRAEGVSYPALISFSFLHLSFWALLALTAMAWIAPAGPFATPGPVNALVGRVTTLGADFVRLAGPLHVNKVIPVHGYTGVLPFQGSIKLGDRDVMSVKIEDPTLEAPLLLRGAVYDQYTSGGWTTGDRTEISLPPDLQQRIKEQIAAQQIKGTLVPLTITMDAKSVVGTVVFTPGQAVAADRDLKVQVPSGSLRPWGLRLPFAGARQTDQEVLDRLQQDLIGIGVDRDGSGRVLNAQVFDSADQAVPDALVLDPGDRIKRYESYSVTGFVPTVAPDELRAAGVAYPAWVVAGYEGLPATLPARVGDLAEQVAGAKANPYDIAKAIEDYLRAAYPMDYNVPDTPPGRDTVDYFLFDARRGYFDYHASAMVVMLRQLHVPARLAVGFAAGPADLDSQSGSYTIRDTNSYSWPEVYFPKYGWIPFNPTPDRPADLNPVLKDEEAKTKTPTLKDFPNLPVSVGGPFGLIDPNTGITGGGPLQTGGDTQTPWWVFPVIAAFLGAVGVSVRLGWQRSVSGLPYAQQMWEKTVRLASWAGHAPAPGQTPRDYAQRLQKVVRGPALLPELAVLYNRSRFGHREPGEAERQRVDEMWPHLRGALIGRIFRRLLRRGRTQ